MLRAWPSGGWGEVAAARSPTPGEWRLALLQGCFTHLAQALLSSELAAGLSSHLEKFRSVCLGEGGPGGGVQKHDITSARPSFLWRENGLGQMGFPVTNVMGGGREKCEQGEWYQGGIPRAHWNGVLRGCPSGRCPDVKCRPLPAPTMKSYLIVRLLSGSYLGQEKAGPVSLTILF